MKFRVIVADPPWGDFSDKLTMSDVKRGAESVYDTLSTEELKNLPIEKIAADDAVLALWVPSALIPEGLEVMKAWGFDFKQTHIWVKVKKDPLKIIRDLLFKALKNILKEPAELVPGRLQDWIYDLRALHGCVEKTQAAYNDLNCILSFGMGRLFRQTHEICLLGTRGKIYSKLRNKSQRSVHFFPVTKHSAKPEGLQDMLDIMFDNRGKKLEMFARRVRKDWICVGLECPHTLDEDIRDSLKKFY